MLMNETEYRKALDKFFSRFASDEVEAYNRTRGPGSRIEEALSTLAFAMMLLRSIDNDIEHKATEREKDELFADIEVMCIMSIALILTGKKPPVEVGRDTPRTFKRNRMPMRYR